MDIALARILGASAVLLPWAWWLMRPARLAGEKVGSLWGLSPLPLRQTVQTGLLGGFLYAILAYTGFLIISSRREKKAEGGDEFEDEYGLHEPAKPYAWAINLGLIIAGLVGLKVSAS